MSADLSARCHEATRGDERETLQGTIGKGQPTRMEDQGLLCTWVSRRSESSSGPKCSIGRIFLSLFFSNRVTAHPWLDRLSGSVAITAGFPPRTVRQPLISPHLELLFDVYGDHIGKGHPCKLFIAILPRVEPIGVDRCKWRTAREPRLWLPRTRREATQARQRADLQG